jgi:hypothetical protein
MSADWYAPQPVPMSHAGPDYGGTISHEITGQKQQSGGCNLGAVANAFAASLLLYTVVMLEQKEAVKQTRSASETSR